MSPTEQDLRTRSTLGLWVGIVAGFIYVALGVPLFSGGDEWPLAGMTIIVVVVMLLAGTVAAVQGEMRWHRVGIVGFIVGLPIGYVLTSILMLVVVMGSVGS
jgi:hypothetical protein